MLDQTTSAVQALAQLWQASGLDPAALARVRLGGSRSLPSSFAVGAAAQASIAAAGLAAAELWRLRNGQHQTVSVDMGHAVAEFRSERYLRVDDQQPADPWDKIAGAYRCGDGRWLRLHTNFPHHRDGVLKLLGCEHDRASVEAALQAWQAEAFETAASEQGMVVAAMRSFAEWDAHPQAAAVRALPAFTLERIGDAPVQPPAPAERPLSGIRALDLTRVIAGPVCGRTLAAHGAEVLHISSPQLPTIPPLDIDTGRGKRSCHLDLEQAGDRGALQALLRDADLFVQGYRPGGLAERGFGPEQAAALRPGIVYISLSAYGHIGPWAQKRGFDSLLQSACGFNHAEAEAAGQDAPRPLPMQVLDHASGYLMALGAMAALHRRANEGGSWHVRVSLAQTAHWLRGLGRVPGGLDIAEFDPDSLAGWLEESESGHGRLRAVRHAAELSVTPAHWRLPAMPLGTHSAGW
ncbi:CoA transferase [Chitinimonas arctica]|uniref:CoA transferase n=1 Tax=Chitinimonas arctica TaxID=2594795 RepID=A0A516SB77_9NEIS|nr:CoA transferase [Chitinimonas arctica]QDQ25401.1 CoA transferase [Chitinimonas arctica]